MQLLLPLQLADVDPAHKVRDFGLVNGAGRARRAGRAAGVRRAVRPHPQPVGPPPGVGGRRRGRCTSSGLLLTGARRAAGSRSPARWLVAQLGMYAAMAGLTATIADQVPPEHRGAVSAAVYGPQALGIVLGLGLVTALGGGAGSRLRRARRRPASSPRCRGCCAPARRRPPAGAAAVAGRGAPRRSWRRRRAHPDYAWAFGGRLLVNLGNALGTTYLLYFLTDGLRVADPEGSLLVLTLVYLVATVAATWGGGSAVRPHRPPADLRRRRRGAAGAGLRGAGGRRRAGPARCSPGLLLGAGYGAYTSVDQALVTQVLPDPRTVAGDLGVMNVAAVAPQALAPAAGRLVIAELGGYGVLFALAGLITVLGALSVARIRSVR